MDINFKSHFFLTVKYVTFLDMSFFFLTKYVIFLDFDFKSLFLTAKYIQKNKIYLN